MEVRDFQDVLCDIVDPIIDVDFTAGRAKAGFTGEGNPMLKSAAGANISGISAFRVTAEHHSLDDICNVGTLIGRNFFLHAKIAPAIPMIAEDLAEPVMASWMIGTLERRTNDLLWTIWRTHANYIYTARTTLLYFVRDNTKSIFVHNY